MRLDYAMRIAPLVAAALLSPASIDRHQFRDRPRVDRVEPSAAKPGAVLAAFGVNLDRSQVTELMLSGQDVVALTHIVEQQEDMIRFRIPRSVMAGRYNILLALSDHWEPELLEQPVFVTVLEPD